MSPKRVITGMPRPLIFAETMPDIALTPVASDPLPSATDRLYDALYAAVISLSLTPGAKLSETEVARQLDVSRQPVRDAFFRLSSLGFLQIRPQRATLVTRISARAVLDAAFVRTALEAECVRLAARKATATELEDLRADLARQEAALRDGDIAALHALDEAFHRRLCKVAGHAHAWDLIQKQKGHMDRVRFLTLSVERGRKVVDEHAALLSAIEARDPDLADRSIRVHLGRIEEALAQVRDEYPQYFEDDAI